METQTQQPTGMDVLLTTDLGADESRTQGRAWDWNSTARVVFNFLSRSAFPRVCFSEHPFGELIHFSKKSLWFAVKGVWETPS